MFGSIGRITFRVIVAVVIAGPMLVIAGGCSDVLTYANKSREEGMHRYAEKAYGDAAGAFRDAIKQDPRDYHSHFYLGVCYNEMQQHQEAFQEYKATLDVMAYTQEGKHDDQFRLQVLDTLASAIARFDTSETELNALELRAKQLQKAEDWFVLGKVYRLRGDADSAIGAYRRAAQWDQASFPIRKEFGLYLLDPLNQNKDAEYYLRQAYRLEPNDSAVNAGLERLGVTPLPAYKAKDLPQRTPSVKTPMAPVQPAVRPAPAAPLANGSAQLPRD